MQCRAANRERTRATCQSARAPVRVAVDHVDAVGIDAEPVGHELLVRRDQTSSIFLIAHDEIDAVPLELDRCRLGKSAAAALRVGRHADASELAALLALLAPRLEAI